MKVKFCNLAYIRMQKVKLDIKTLEIEHCIVF
jgi:hypothetical protein